MHMHQKVLHNTKSVGICILDKLNSELTNEHVYAITILNCEITIMKLYTAVKTVQLYLFNKYNVNM